MKTNSMRLAGERMRAAPSPAVAGFRPVAMALAVAGAFSSAVQAQPTGAQAIHGSATLQQQGNTLVVTTQNGVGTNHSAVNWQSFSIPGGTTTRFDQPTATSTSINRVLGNDPSQIFGTLSSNGRLVLVNPAGIAVGAGAVVDTAGFTASTLRMSDADALAGRLVFGDGTGAGLLSVSGQIIGRQGDVVLIAPDVRVGEQAIVQAPNGATLLAAGQKVALTGRGLEGIQLELRAPEDQAVNLGTLQGDAVGIFASQLKHSGAIQATGVSVEGGKVVLKAAESADVAGTVTATRGTVGGQVHATANKVMLRSGAVIDVSGRDGGGEALIGGGWQGQDGRIANAQETTIEAGATLRADAIERGNGGTIVAWSNGATRVYGSLSARGGAESGDGGKVETSGHYLDMQGQVDTRAPNGRIGELLLDPTNMWIANDLASAQAAGMPGSDATDGPPNFTPTTSTASDSLVTVSSLQSYLSSNNVVVRTTNSLGTGAGNITVVDPISWTGAASPTELGLWADQSIAINAAISSSGGALVLRADSGNITQSAAITTNSLIAYAQAGSVTLTNTGNSVSSLAGYAGSSGGFSFTNTGNLGVNPLSSANGMGLFNGIRSAGPVTINVMGGSLAINDTTYGVEALGNAVVLTTTGDLDSYGATINAGSGNIALTAGGIISLSTDGVVKLSGGNVSVTGSELQLNGTQITAADTIKLASDELQTGFGASISAGNLIEVQTKSGGREIQLAPTILGISPDSILDLDYNTIGSFSTPGVLRIGSTISGPLTVMSSIAPSAGTLSLVSGSTISQDAVATITVPKLALKALGDVNLDQSNNVSELAASLGDGVTQNQRLRFVNGSSLTVGSGIDGLSGIGISIGGTYDSSTPDGVISLTAAGTLTQAAGALLAGKAVYAEGSSVILNEANTTGVIAGKATGGSTATFQYASSNAISLDKVDDVFSGFSGGVSSSGLGGNAIQLKGTSVSQQAGAAVTSGGGLQVAATSGGVTLLDPANDVAQLSGSATGSIDFYDGTSLDVASLSSSGGSISVASGGAMQVWGPVTASNNAITFGAATDLSVDGSISAGSGPVSLSAGSGGLIFGSTASVAAGSMRLQADNMSVAGSISATGMIEVLAQSAGRQVELGSALLDGTALQLSGIELASFSTPGVLRIGSASSGNIIIGAPIAPTGAGVLSLQTGGSIQQNTGAVITAPKLALRAGGDVSLTGANQVGEVAALLTGTNANFSFTSAQSLNVGAGLDGLSGIMLSGDANNFDPLNPNTVIALTSAGTLTQSAGALLAGKAVYAEGASVVLTEANPTGVIAGKATGGAADVFHYTSSNGIAVSTVNGFSGVQNLAGTGADAIVLQGTNVNQGAGASIVSAGGLQLTATAGDVFLPESSNSVASLSGSAAGSFKFFNTGDLVLNGVSAGGSVDVAGGGALSLSQGIVAGAGVKLTGASVSQAAGASIVAGSGGLLATASSGGITLDDNGNSVGSFSGSALGDIHLHDAGALTLGSLSGSGLISITSAGALTVTQGISASAGVDLGGSSISQTAGASIVSAGGLLVNATAGSVALGDSGNNVASLTGTASGDLAFYNATSLTLGSLNASSGSVAVGSAEALTVSQNIAAGNGILLGAEGGDLNVGASLNAGSGGVSLASASGSIFFNGAAGVAGAGDAFFSAPLGAVRIASGTTTLASNVSSTQTVEVDGGTLFAASAVTIPNLLLANGTLDGADVTIGSHFDWTGGQMIGSGKTTIGGGATADIYGPVTAARPMINDGSIFLWGSGNITVGSGFSLVNNGLFEIQNDGGFSGGMGSIVNNGTFRKGSTLSALATTEPLAFTFASGASPVDVASFTNTGRLDVMQGTLQFAPLAFSTNAGGIWLESGATLDNSDTSLASSGWIKGSGTLALGTGTLDNSGELAPGGLGSIGTLTIQAATVNLKSGSTLLVDVADAANHDLLQASGDVNLASGAGVSLGSGSAALLPGEGFDVIASSAGMVGGVLPTVSGYDAAFVAAPASLRLSIALPPPPPPPAPAPAPSTSPLVDRILDIVPDASPSLITAMLSEQDNPLTTFTTLLLEEEQAQGKDAVVNEVSGSQICKP